MERSMKMQDLLLAAAWMGFATAVSAVTLIEERDSEPTTSMSLDDGKMRVETAGGSSRRIHRAQQCLGDERPIVAPRLSAWGEDDHKN